MRVLKDALLTSLCIIIWYRSKCRTIDWKTTKSHRVPVVLSYFGVQAITSLICLFCPSAEDYSFQWARNPYFSPIQPESQMTREPSKTRKPSKTLRFLSRHQQSREERRKFQVSLNSQIRMKNNLRSECRRANAASLGLIRKRTPSLTLWTRHSLSSVQRSRKRLLLNTFKATSRSAMSTTEWWPG